MSNNINFLKKKTVLNDILSNRNVSVINNTKYDPNDENDKGLLLNTINNAEINTDKYIISYDNVDLNISYNDIKELYRSKSWLSNNQVSFDEFKDNVNYYNNYNKNGIQDLTYVKYDQSLNTNTLLIDNTYNSLYYVRPDKINLISYSIKNTDGFNYDENNHILKFNIDNNYIKSINNLLYYNYNNIRNTSSDKTGIASIDDKFFDVKNYNNSYSNNILTINKEFKTEIYSTLNKIKNLYNDCKVTYNIANPSSYVEYNGDNYGKIGNISYFNTEIRFEDPKLYYDDDVVGVNSLDLANADTLYVFDLDNADFRLGYTDTLDYDYKENQYTSNASANSLSNDVKNSTLKNRISLTLSENDASANIIANQHIKSNHVIGTTYNINLGDISKNSFNANGLSILYKASPYKISTENSGQLITIPYDKELNIRKIAGTFGKYFYTTEIERIAEYLFVSSHYDIKGFRIPDSSFAYLKSRNTITDIFNLQYYSVLKAGYGYPEVYPILNLYPNNYINEKYFDSDLISYYENNDTAYSEIIATEDELSTCVSKIRDIYLDDVKCLYFYKLLHKDGYYETVGEPNMLIFEEDIDSYLTFIARNDVKFTFTVPEDAEDNVKYIQFSLDGVTWEYLINDPFIDDISQRNYTQNGRTYILKHEIENSNKILWRAKFYNFKLSDDHKYIEDTVNENNELINDKPYYVYPQHDSIKTTPNLTNGIGTFGATCSNGEPKFEIFGNSMSLIYGCPYIEYIDEISNEKTNVYCTKLSDKPHIFDKLFSGSYIVSAKRLALPATSLEKSNFCYQEMFLNCDHLTDSPKLPAEMLSDRCYKGMFKNCIALQSAPRLDAFTMKPECYKEMFRGCKALLMPPNVTKKYPTGIFMSKELAYGCYESMFEGCENLRVMPQLTASKMKENCYKKMFKDCGQISKAVNLPVIQEFAKSCFYFMFYNTQIIPHIVTSGLKINLCEGLYFNSNNDNEQEKFVNNVRIGALQGIFGGTDIVYEELAKFLPKDKHNNAYLNTYLNETYNNLDVECYLDMFYNADLLDKAPYIPATEMKRGCYYRMFYGCHSLQYIPEFTINTSAEECCYQMFYEAGTKVNNYLTFRNSGFDNSNNDSQNTIRLSLSNDTDVLSKKCYYQMFFGCDKLYDYNLEDQPIQIITTIGGIGCEEQSCESMFEGCTNIKYTTSSLPATTLAEASYKNMYKNCSALIYGPSIAATIVAKESCISMFEGCSDMSRSTSPSLTSLLAATILYEATYKNMYKSCSSLTHGPQINTQILANQCCMSMFEGCTSLTNTTSSLPATILKDECYKNMYKNCRSLSVAPSIDNPENTTTLAKECCMSMFEGCTHLIKSPDLSATKLVENCYERMFYGCENLIFIKALFLTAPMNEAGANTIVDDSARAYATESWVNGVVNFDKNTNNLIDSFEDYNEKYSHQSQQQIQFTDNLINAIKNRIIDARDIDNDNKDNDYYDVNGNLISNGLGLFIRNSHAEWIIKENIGVDGIPKYWNVYSSEGAKEYPVFVFFHSDSYRNYEDYSKLIYGFPGDNYGDDVPNSNMFPRRGYSFSGWSNLKNSNNVDFTSITIKNQKFIEDKQYWAVWNANTYDIYWYYNLENRLYDTTSGAYDTLISDHKPNPMPDIISPIPTHHYPYADGYIFWSWSSIQNPQEQLVYVNRNTPTDYFMRPIDVNGPGYDSARDNVNPQTPQLETDTVGLNGENNFYAVWKYIVKWNIKTNYNEGYYTPDSDNNIIADYYYQNNYFYNDYLLKTQDGKLDVPNPAVNINGKYKFGGWTTNKGPVEDNPYLPDVKVNDNTGSLYSETIDEIYSSIQRGVDKIPTLLRENCECNHVKAPKNYYTTWRYEIIWYEGNNGVYTPFVTNYGYYNDYAAKYRPMENNGVDYKNPERQNCRFYGWASEPNLTNPDLDRIIIKNSGSDDNTIYPVWKYGVVWMTRKNDADENCGYYTAPYTNGYSENCYEQSEYLYGDTLILPDRNPIRDDEDYIFDTTIYNDVCSGWADYAGPQQDKGIWKPNINKNYQVTDSATFYAVYKPAITWHYYENDILTNSKTYGYYYDNALSNSNKLSDPSNNTRYRFIGWNSYPNQREADNDNEIIIKNPASNNIYGVWYYSVKWYTNGGSYSNTGNGYYQNYYYQDNYLYNDNIIKPESNPTRNDYEFAGWSVNQSPSDNNIWKEDTDITNQTKKIIDSIDVYSVWKSAIYWYDYNGNLLATTYGYYNDNITNYTPSDPSRTGYTFQGWNTNSGQSNGNINGVKVGDPSNNKFYAAYTVNIYTIYWYNYDGTTLLKTTTGDYDSYVSLHIPKNDDNTNYEPIREGYTFKGWNTNTNQTSGNIDNIRVKTSGNNFYAAYTVNQMTVTFKVAGTNYGYIDSEGITVKYIYPNYGSTIGSVLNALYTAGGSPQYKDTTGWKREDTGTEVTLGTTVTSSMTLVPIPERVRTFTVTFKVAGSVYESVTTSSIERSYGAEIGTLPTASDNQGIYQNTSRWRIENSYEVSSSERVYNNMTLVPIEGNPNDHTVTFHCSDGFTINGNTEVSYPCTHNNSINTCLPNGTWPSATRVGYNPDFITTWKFNSGGNDGTVANLDYTVTDNIVLYMDTTEIAPKRYTITFTVNGTDYESITSATGDGKTMIWELNYGQHLGEYNNDGTLPQANDSDGQYEPTRRWKIYGTDEEVTAQTQVTSNMTLVPTGSIPTKFTVTFTVTGTEYNYISASDGNYSPIVYQDVEYGTTLGELLNDNELPQAIDSDGVYESTRKWKIEGTPTIVTANFEVKSDLTLIPAGDVVTHTVIFTVNNDDIYNYIGNDTSTTYLEYNVIHGTTLGQLFQYAVLPTAYDNDNMYKSTARWETNENDSEEVTISTEVLSDMTLVPIPGDPIKYTVTFMVGDTGYDYIDITDHPAIYDCMNVSYGTTLGSLFTSGTLPQAVDTDNMYEPTTRWETNENDSEEVTTQTPVTRDITLIPIPGGIQTFTVTWHANQGIIYNWNSNIEDDDLIFDQNYNVVAWIQHVNYGDTLTLPSIPNDIAMYLDNYEFTGNWYEEQVGLLSENSEDYADYDPILAGTPITENKTYYASWRRQNTVSEYFTITYNNRSENVHHTGTINITLPSGHSLSYSEDGMTWQDAADGLSIQLDIIGGGYSHKSVYFKGKRESNLNKGIVQFGLSTSDDDILNEFFEVSGDAMTLLYNSKVIDNNVNTDHAFEKLFFNCDRLVYVDDLILSPTTLGDRCCYQMFYNCTYLLNVPLLSATTIGEYCYYGMFSSCTTLKVINNIPELPATTLATSCYESMFEGCTALTTAPELPAETLENSCYDSMFKGCTSLTTPPTIEAKTLANSCCFEMFMLCTSLTTSPILYAETLVQSCYMFMFYGCKSLNEITCLATNLDSTNSESYLSAWVGGTGVEGSGSHSYNGEVYGVQQSGTLYCKNSTMKNTWETLTTSGYSTSGRPHDWNVKVYGASYYTITWNAGGGLFEVLNDNFSHNDLIYDENDNLIGFSTQVSGEMPIPIPSWTGDDGIDSYKFYRTGYSFVDWYDSPAEPLQQEQEEWADDYPIQSVTIASGNKTYYARWRVNSKPNLVLFDDLENQPLNAEISPLTDQESSVDVHVITDYGYANGVANDGKYLTANVIVTSGDALISPSNEDGSGPSGAWSQSLSGIYIFEDVVYSQSTVVPDEPGTGDDSEQHDTEEYHHIGIKMFWIKTPNSYNSTSNISVEIIGASGTTNGVSDFTTFRNNYELTTQFNVTTRSSSGGGTPGGDPTEEDEEEANITMTADRSWDNRSVLVQITNNGNQTYSNCLVTLTNLNGTVITSKYTDISPSDITNVWFIDAAGTYSNAVVAYLYNGNTQLANAII